MTVELLGAFERSDSTVVAVAGGATLNALSVQAPAFGILRARVSSSAALTWTLAVTGGATASTGAVTNGILSVPVNAGQRVTLSATAGAGPVFSVNAALELVPGFPDIPAPAATGAVVLQWDGATLGWVSQAAAGVTSYNTRTGAVVGVLADVTSLFGAKGDLFVGAGAGAGQLQTVGADTTVLTADSSQAGGVRWAAVATPSSGDSDQFILPGQIFS